MIRALLLSLLFLPAAAPAAGAGPACRPGEGERACVLQAIWEAASSFPADKQDRLKPVFLDTVALSGDAALLAAWRERIGGVAAPRQPYPDYVRGQAEAELQEAGWDGFLQRANAGLPPFNTGRPELMAAGVRLAPDAATRRRVVDAMFRLAGPPGSSRVPMENFERGDFGHVLAELAMEDCDLASFDRALPLTLEPDGLRYAFWRARITGDATSLVPRVRAEGPGDDTRSVRAALEGYGAILQHGYCPG
ncbi:MAG: hypothetical protein R3C08_01260 [Hyphomonas sp.]